MIMGERTIENLRKSFKGRIYVLLSGEKICQRFLQDAQNEGYRFGKLKPTECGNADIVAVEGGKQLSHVGFVGHMAFQCGGGASGNLVRVDYKKYASGDDNFIIGKLPQLKQATVQGKFFKNVEIIGQDSESAARHIRERLADCKTEADEDELYAETERLYSVSVLN